MKIALLTTDNREHHCQYGLTEPYFGTAPEALLQGFAESLGIQVHVVSCSKQHMTSPEKLADNIWFHSLVVPQSGWLRTGYQGCIRAVRKKLQHISPDVVHGQGTERDCAISAVFSGYPNIITIHGNMRLIAKVNAARPFSYQWLAATLERWTVPRSDGVVCITRYTEKAVRRLARKTWVLPNAVDQTFFSVERSPDEIPIILCVGHVIPRKNQNALIRALDVIAAQVSFRLVFLGDAAPNSAYAREFLQLTHERDWCEHAGIVDRKSLRAWLGRARMLVMPSLEENCPMVLLEAMAAGVPAIAADVGGVRDLITENVNGILFDPTNAGSMRSTVARMLKDNAEADAMSQIARRDAFDRFHPSAIAAGHVQIYREVVR